MYDSGGASCPPGERGEPGCDMYISLESCEAVEPSGSMGEPKGGVDRSPKSFATWLSLLVGLLFRRLKMFFILMDGMVGVFVCIFVSSGYYGMQGCISIIQRLDVAPGGHNMCYAGL